MENQKATIFQMLYKVNMDKNKNLNIASTSNADIVEQDVSPAPDEFYDDYTCDELYYYSICMSCQYWNGYMCDAENGACNYEPF